MIKATLENTDRVIAQLSQVGPRIQSRVRVSVRALTIELKGNVKRNKLSGQVLRRRTGTLSRSLDDAIIETPQGVVGVVSTNVKYGRAHEYGFNGAVTVKAHLRTIKQAWGRPIAPTQVSVNSFTRTMNLPQRSFLRSALGEFQGKIQMSLAEAINGAMKPGGGMQ